MSRRASACFAVLPALLLGAVSGLTWAGDQFAVIRPPLRFDAANSWPVYPGAETATAKLLAGGGTGPRPLSGPVAEHAKKKRGRPSNYRGASRRRGSRQTSPFEAGTTPLLRDLPAVERDPPNTRRRPLGW